MKLKKIRIRILQKEEKYHSGFNGEYKDNKGNIYLLTNPQARTLEMMRDKRTPQEQFNFFCFAYLRGLMFSGIELFNNKFALKKYQRLIGKYGMPWSGNVKHVLPPIEPVMDLKVLSKKGINSNRLINKFNKLADYEFILYPSVFLQKNKNSVFIKRCKESHDPGWDFDVGNYTVYYDIPHPYASVFAVSKSAPPELKKRLIVAAKSFEIGNHSIDYVLKSYSYDWGFGRETNHTQEKLFDLLRILTNILEGFYAQQIPHEGGRDILGMIAAEAALVRCVGTFHSIFCLLGRGYFIEPLVLARHIVEQVAWALAINQMDDLKKIEKVMPQKEIKYLNFHPNGGRLYGTLSEFVHLSSKKRYEYYRVQGNKGASIHQSVKHSLRLAPYLILVLDIYFSAYEKICLDHYQNVQSWARRKDGVWELNKNRPLAILWNRHKKKLISSQLYHK